MGATASNDMVGRDSEIRDYQDGKCLALPPPMLVDERELFAVVKEYLKNINSFATTRVEKAMVFLLPDLKLKDPTDIPEDPTGIPSGDYSNQKVLYIVVQKRAENNMAYSITILRKRTTTGHAMYLAESDMNANSMEDVRNNFLKNGYEVVDVSKQ